MVIVCDKKANYPENQRMLENALAFKALCAHLLAFKVKDCFKTKKQKCLFILLQLYANKFLVAKEL